MEKLRALAAQLEAARQNASDLETVRKNMIDSTLDTLDQSAKASTQRK